MIVETLPVGLLRCNCTIIGDPHSREAIVIDPGDEVERIRAVLERHSLRCVTILNTHAHIDHVGANAPLKQFSGARLMMHPADFPLYDNLTVQSEWMGGAIPAQQRADVDVDLEDGQHLQAGMLEGEVLHTPGHTPGSVCLHVPGDAPLLLSGDTLFAGSIGRTDLWGGDYEQEIRSIRTRLLSLDEKTRVIPGHGPETTIGNERRCNPFLVNS